jgi:hypothetical protein
MKQKRKFLLQVKKSRKQFVLAYFLSLLLVFSVLYLIYRGYNVSLLALGIATFFFLITLFVAEVIHTREWWAITESSLIHSESILNKNVREIDFSSISDLDIDQPLIARILGYGTVHIRLFLNETSVSIKNINSPENFIEELKTAMSVNQWKRGNGIRKI